MEFGLSEKEKQQRLRKAVVSGILAGGLAFGSSSAANVAFAAEQTADAGNSTIVRTNVGIDTNDSNTKSSATRHNAMGTTRNLARGTVNAMAANRLAVQNNKSMQVNSILTAVSPKPTWERNSQPNASTLDLRTDMTNYGLIAVRGTGDVSYIQVGSNSNINGTEFLTARDPASSSDDAGEMVIEVLNPGESVSYEKASTAVADFTNSTFVHQGGDIIFVSGTAVTKASAFKSSQNAGQYGGSIRIGNFATVKLQGNTAFDTSAKNYIVLDSKGTLEAESAQIFTNGLGVNGAVLNPASVRSDVNDAVNFKAGTVLLDDTVYNTTYLEQANTLIKAADGGSTNVEINSSATKVTPSLDIGSLTNDSYFAPVKANKTDITISTAGGDSTVDTFNAQSLNLNAPAAGTANTVTVDGKKLHLGSSTNGQHLITSGDAVPALPVALAVKNSGSLVLGTGNATNTLTADVTLGTDGSLTDATTMTVSNGTQIVTSIVANKSTTVTVDAGAVLKAANAITMKSGSKMNLNGTLRDTAALTLENGSMMNLNGTLTGTKVTGATGAVLNIGDSTHAGILSLASGSTLTGTTVFLDPAWSVTDEITDASKLADSNTTLDYSLTVGQNSVASLGTSDNSEAETYFAQSAQSWGEDGITAALYLAKPITLTAATGGIKVDGSLTTSNIVSNYAAANTATFGANSLLIVNTANLGGSAALKSTKGTLTVDNTAKLYLTDTASAAVGTTYTIVSGFTTTTDAKGWYTTANNIIMNKLLTKSVANGTVTITGKRSLAEALPNAVLRNTVDHMTLSTTSSNAGIKYLSNVLTGAYTDDEATAMINTAAQAAETVGSAASAVANAMDFADTAQQHFSFIDDIEGTHNQDIWVKYTHNKTNVSGAQLSGMTAAYNSNYNSVIVGCDIVTKDTFSSGVALTYGSGNAGGSVEHDSYTSWGASYYGSLRNRNTNLLFDAGYSQTDHDVSGTVAASPKNKIFTMGITGEYKYHQGNTDIIPHIGLRYLYVNTPAYDGSIDGQTAFHYAPDNKNLFVLPIGIGFNTNYTRKDGWHFKVHGDVSYLGVLGGRSGSMNVSVPDVNGMDRVGYDLMDRSSFLGRIGVELSTDNVNLDLGYSYQKGSSHEANRFMATCSISF